MLGTGTKTLYSNKIGIAFRWKKRTNCCRNSKTINVIFQNMGFRFDVAELKVFLQDIEFALTKPIECKGDNPKDCQSIILATPLSQLSLAMSYNELLLMKDLVSGTLFDLELSTLLNKIVQ